jgi:hypothetical protein
MNCIVFAVDLTRQRRYAVGSVRSHTEMNDWLKTRGQVDTVYEIWKGPALHSRWCWKEKKGRWGRMATPSKKTDILEDI